MRFIRSIIAVDVCNYGLLVRSIKMIPLQMILGWGRYRIAACAVRWIDPSRLLNTVTPRQAALIEAFSHVYNTKRDNPGRTRPQMFTPTLLQTVLEIALS
jgi:hypothetical protein